MSAIIVPKLSDLVKVWRSYNKNNFACFFETRCITADSACYVKFSVRLCQPKINEYDDDVIVHVTIRLTIRHFLLVFLENQLINIYTYSFITQNDRTHLHKIKIQVKKYE